MLRDKFKFFIIISLAVVIALGGVSFAKLESTSSRQKQELQEERLNNCKLKLYDLAVGYEAHAVHTNPHSPQYDPRQAAVIAGALRVVQSIPSSRSCVPQARSAIEHTRIHGTERLPRSVEHELIKLAAFPTHGGVPRPITRRTVDGGGRGRRHSSRPTPRRKVPQPTPTHPPSVNPAPSPAPSLAPTSTQPRHPAPRVTVPGPPHETPSVTVTVPIPAQEPPPPPRVPPVTVETPPVTVETPPVTLPCVKLGKVELNCRK